MFPKTFVFIGRSGCGKGTQANLIMDYLKKTDPNRGIFHLETGVRFREFIKGKGYTQDLSREIYEAGGIQPEFLVIWIWGGTFIEKMEKEHHIVLDGTPRKPHEARILDSAFSFYKREKPFMVHLSVSRDWAEKKLLARKRADDNVADIKARLDWYETDVVPTIAFYRDNPRYNFLEINGERSIEEIHQEIIGIVEKESVR